MYATLKLLHLAAVVLFLGNVYTGLYWKARADRSRDPRIIAHTFDGIIRSDRLFTLPGAALILLLGYAAARSLHVSLFGTPWIWSSLALFGISGAIVGVFVAPAQLRLRNMAAAAFDEASFDWPAYGRQSLVWEIWGWAALATPLAAVAVMVFKPVF